MWLQGEELEEALLDAVQWRYRPLITIQLAIRNISRAKAALQKTI